jgi:pyruvate dehydrogenase E1 component alpha subunit
VLAVHATAARAVARARAGEGPTFLLFNTYRYRGHHVGDINRTYYRSKDEEHQWMTVRDPIGEFARWLTTQGAATTESLEAVKAREEAAIDRAMQFALDAPYPDPRDVGLHIYA